MSFIKSLNPIEIMLGKVPGLRYVNIYGRNSDVDTGSVPECIWSGQDRYAGFDATAAQTLDISSTDSGDTSLQVTIHGLNASYVEISETVTLNASNATTPVTTVNSYLRCSFAYVTSPTTATNLGDIEGYQSTANHKMFDMPAGQNNTHIAVYTVPANKKAYIEEVGFSLARSSGTSADVDIFVRRPGQPFRSKLPLEVSQAGGPIILNGSTPLIQNLDGDLSLPAQTDIEMVCTDVSQNNATITGFMRILLEDV